MVRSDLQPTANAVVRRAQRQGFVVPNEIKQELAAVGHDEERWREVIELVRDSLHYRQGRYYHISAISKPSEHRADKNLHDTIQNILAQQSPVDQEDNREENRRQVERTAVSFIVKIQDEDGQEFTVLSRDLSPTGIRLVSSKSFLGHKVRVSLPDPDSSEKPVSVWVRIIWTSTVSDDLYENGGTFLEVCPV